MSDVSERIAVPCPSCSPGGQTVHEVLKPGGQATVRCTECGHTHKTKIERERTVDIDVVVSQDGDSFHASVEAPAEESIAVGDEFIVDTPEAIMQVRITSLEVGDERRAEESTAEDVETVWSRVVDNVRVNVTLHPKDGGRDETRSIALHVPGDYEFEVGRVEEFGDEEFEITGVHVRDDADYRFDKMDHDGDVVFAKDVKRVYGRDRTTSAWSAW
jgi:uncharacterized Zn finger protein